MNMPGEDITQEVTRLRGEYERACEELAQGKVWKGEDEQIRLGIRDDLFVTIPRGRYDDLDAQVEMRPELIAPLAARASERIATFGLSRMSQMPRNDKMISATAICAPENINSSMKPILISPICRLVSSAEKTLTPAIRMVASPAMAGQPRA